MLIRTLTAVLAGSMFAAGPATATGSAVSMEGPLVVRSESDTRCGTLLWNADQTFEAACGWEYEGVVPPYYGAFAESYHGEWDVCAAVFGFTRSYDPMGEVMDVYVWEDAGGIPGNILCLVADIDPGPVAEWPYVSYHRVKMTACCTGNDWWVGYWGNWPGEQSWWYIASDEDGQGGTPKTNIAPGLGYPTGWQDNDVPFGPTNALAIGAEVIPCGSTPTGDTTWGRIKAVARQR